MSFLGIVSCHIDSAIHYYSVLYNLRHLTRYLKDLVFIETNSKNIYSIFIKKYIEKNFNIIKSIYKSEELHNPFEEWKEALYMIDYKKYDYITFLNDDILITRSIDDYFESVLEKDVELYAFIDSYEIQYHYSSFLMTLKRETIQKFITFIHNQKNRIKSYIDIWHMLEVPLMELFETRDCHFKNKITENIFLYNDRVYQELFESDQLPILLLDRFKRSSSPSNDKVYPYDFDIEYYRNTHKDLFHLNNQELIHHYMSHGIEEGRIYKEHQKIGLPYFIEKKIKKIFETEMPKAFYIEEIKKKWNPIMDIDFVSYYIPRNKYKVIPVEFDLDYYRKMNPDLHYLSNRDLYTHFLTNGQFENRRFNPESRDNVFIFYDKINKLPPTFQASEYIELNPDLRTLFTNEIDIQNHFMKKGVHEGRVFSANIVDHFPYMNGYFLLHMYEELERRIHIC